MKLTPADILYGISDTELCDLLEKAAFAESDESECSVRETLAYVAMERIRELKLNLTKFSEGHA